jgi:hypothetical protein
VLGRRGREESRIASASVRSAVRSGLRTPTMSRSAWPSPAAPTGVPASSPSTASRPCPRGRPGSSGQPYRARRHRSAPPKRRRPRRAL